MEKVDISLFLLTKPKLYIMRVTRPIITDAQLVFERVEFIGLINCSCERVV